MICDKRETTHAWLCHPSTTNRVYGRRGDNGRSVYLKCWRTRRPAVIDRHLSNTTYYIWRHR